MAIYYGNTESTSSGSSSFRIVCEYTASNQGNGCYQYRYRFYVQVTKGNFYGTNLSTSWGSNVTIRGAGKYGYSGYKTKNVAYGSKFTLGTTAYAQYTSSSTYRSQISGSTAIASVPRPKYTVAYNANGGSGAPSKQTKTYGITLKLSSSKPTRTGYSFQGWGTTSTDTSVNYAAGAKYTANAGITLYAIWKANTYTVKFDANGGSGAPSNQTKTYGVNLTLSSTKPTRTNYNFLGWGTSASSTTVAYAAGATYSSNAAITLYAIWELAYVKPTVSNLKVSRCTSSGTADEMGTYAKVTFSWKCDQTIGTNNVSSVKISWGSSSTTVTASGTSGNVSTVVGGGTLSIESSYTITATVTDEEGGSTSLSTTLPTTKFSIDIKSGGTGVAIGKVADTNDLFDVALKSRFRDIAYIANDKPICGATTSGTDISIIYVDSSDNTVVGYGGYINEIGATIIYGNSIKLYSKDGIIQTGATLNLTKTTDLDGEADNKPALIVGSMSGQHIEMDTNEIHAKSSGTSVGSLYINGNGGNVEINGCLMAKNTILWSGVSYMGEDQTATFSDSILDYPTGAVFVWSSYSDGASSDTWFHHFFVPKHQVSAHSGRGVAMTSPYGGMRKYIYISATKATGNAINKAADTTQNGISQKNRLWVLRYVIGV